MNEILKELNLKRINSDNSFLENRNLYNISQKFYSVETQTPKSIINKKAKSKKNGFNYKIINLGSSINFNERNIGFLLNYFKESSKTCIDLSNPLTITYKAYQKKKNEKKYNNKFPLKDLPKKGSTFKTKFILPMFNSALLNNNNSFYKKNNQNLDYEYTNLK